MCMMLYYKNQIKVLRYRSSLCETGVRELRNVLFATENSFIFFNDQNDWKKLVEELFAL